jgi:ABC-type transporter Mla subunit MlaD
MDTRPPLQGSLRKAVAAFLTLSVVSSFAATQATHATSISDLQAQQQALEQQAKQAQQQAEANKTLAQRAADSVVQVSGQIDQLNDVMQDTATQIGTTQTQIVSNTQQLADLQAQMTQIETQRDAVVVALYEMQRTYPDDLLLFSGDVSKRAKVTTDTSSLEKALQAIVDKTNQAEAAVNAERDQLERQNTNLQTLSQQQQTQQQSLADYKQTQAQLQTNATAAEQQLEAQATQAQAQANQIAAKIQLLSNTSNWGSQIISDDSGGWYYSQTGDPTRLGSSYETVNNVGCLITSIAMVSTFYGDRITPDYIARNGGFSGDGSYYWGTPPGLGVSLHPSGKVNWNIVASEVDAGRPVIVSIYLPSVGAINSDGSSHFVVIKGEADGKFIMQDPIGPGRSYNLSQVRSMILTTAS